MKKGPSDKKRSVQTGRYMRQIALKEIGQSGQQRLGSGSVLILGCGGLGTNSAMLLARAGVGRLIIVDGQTVEKSNLHRQVLYHDPDIGMPKAAVASERLQAANPDVDVIAIIEEVDGPGIHGLLRGVDVVVDGTDNMVIRRVLNKACVKNMVPWVFAGVEGTAGMSMTVLPGRSPCLECVFPKQKTAGPSSGPKASPILNTVPAVLGAVQATEAIKLLLGQAPRPGLLVYDLWSADIRVVNTKKDRNCPVCGNVKR